jgi:hypothetical protein
MIRDLMPYSRIIEYCDCQASKIKKANPLSTATQVPDDEKPDPWVLDALEVSDPARVIQALSFGKRFSPKTTNMVQSDPEVTFRKLQKELKSRPENGGAAIDSDVIISGGILNIALPLLRFHYAQLVGEAPSADDLDKLPSVILSPGTSLYDGGLTNRNPAEKIWATLSNDAHAPNYHREWSISRKTVVSRVKDAVWPVRYVLPDPDELYYVRLLPEYDPRVLAHDPYHKALLAVQIEETLQFATVDYEYDPNSDPEFLGDDGTRQFIVDPLYELRHQHHTSRSVPLRIAAAGVVFEADPNGAPGSSWRVVPVIDTLDDEHVDLMELPRTWRSEAIFCPEFQLDDTYYMPASLVITEYYAADEHVVKFVAVPKSFNKKRGISIDRPQRMSAQLKVKTLLERALSRAWVLSVWMNLRDQQQNRDIARIGAMYGEFATTDISSASDWISRGLSEIVVPGGWFSLFDETRPTAIIVNGSAVKMHTLAPMGCGWTFHNESAFYVAVAMTAYDIADMFGIVVKIQHVPPCFQKLVRYAKDHDSYHGIAVRTRQYHQPYLVSGFGDDIEVPVEIAPIYLALCEKLGIKANLDKSFIEGPFRESCGGDWYALENGHVLNATPVYWPRSPLTCFRLSNGMIKFTQDSTVRMFKEGEVLLTTELSKLVEMQHQLWDYAPTACSFLTNFIKTQIPDMTFSPVGTQCSDLWGQASSYGVPAIFDLEKGIVRPLRQGESYLTVTDSQTGEVVNVNAREMHYTPITVYGEKRNTVTRYPAPKLVSKETNPDLDDTAIEQMNKILLDIHRQECDRIDAEIDQAVEHYALEHGLLYGGKPSYETHLGDLRDIPIYPEPVNRKAMTHSSSVRWELK